ncbi:MAG: NAD(P)/FAD-dependent oxidoreductase [Acidobacteriota bacterium]|nr:NAD(P)/FAD-dependent oxidoreductase [Acidobacteriota bacterium]
MIKSKIQNLKPKILIVGAGPSGASLAIRLGKKNFRVCLIERERFPRPKLCGEFISPECLEHFRELDVLDEMLAAGGERISETVFFEPNGKSIGVPSRWFNGDSQGALSLSRAEMDFQLLKKAKRVGVEVLEEHSAVGLFQEDNKIRGLKFRTKDGEMKEIFADLFVDATGRTRVLGKMISREGAKLQGKENSKFKTQNSKLVKIQNPKSKIQNRFIGFKAHLKEVNLEKGVCEIYFFRGGYGGLSFVENGRANFCFLIKAETVKEFSGDAVKIIERLIFQNKRACETLKNAEPVHDWLAVSVDGFGQKDLNPAANLFAVGDAGAFIDPFTGSGMLMAMESAEILAQVIVANPATEKIAEQYKSEHARRFQRRLFISSLMRRAAFAPALSKILISALSIGDFPRKILARATRPTVSVSKIQ